MSNLSTFNLKHKFSILILATLFSSCITGKQLIKLKDEAKDSIEIDQLKHVDFEDTYTSVFGYFGLQIDNQSSLNLGVHAKYQPISIGEFGAVLVRQYSEVNSLGIVRYTSSKSTILNFKFGLTYEFPFTKKKLTKETIVSLYDFNSKNSSYYTIMNVDYLKIWSLRTGIAHIRNEFESESYAKHLLEEKSYLNFDDSFNLGTMLIEQGDYVAKIGLSYSKIYGTTFKANNPEHNFVGLLYKKWSVYGEIQVLAFAQTDEIKFDYSYYDNSTNTNKTVNEFVDPKNFLTKKYLGFALGTQFNLWGGPVSKFSIGVFFEVGSSSGYRDKFSQSFYTEYGFQIGFGTVKQK